MAGTSANHYTVRGHDIDGVVDTAGITGSLAISLQVDGHSVTDVHLDLTDVGIVVTGLVDAVADAHTLLVRLTLPQVNIADQEVPYAGFALVTKSRTSIGGPPMVDGAIQSYELRPVAGIAAVTQS